MKKTADWTSLESHSREKNPFLMIAIDDARISLLYKNPKISQHASRASDFHFGIRKVQRTLIILASLMLAVPDTRRHECLNQHRSLGIKWREDGESVLITLKPVKNVRATYLPTRGPGPLFVYATRISKTTTAKSATVLVSFYEFYSPPNSWLRRECVD